MSTITSMLRSAWWRRAALTGFVLGLVGGMAPLLVR
jgi:hypothetical protein